jgi:SAM-dependent methyltransferase
MILDRPFERDQRLRYDDGRLLPLPLDRWFAEPGPEDHEVLALARSPVLDVGCGPARHTLALQAGGAAVVGVDVAPGAVRAARDRGARVLCRSVFDPLPDEGTCRTVLLLDGNVGIGGDPVALLTRARELLGPGGKVLAEVEPPGTITSAHRVRVEAGSRAGEWLPWAHVGMDGIAGVARAAGLAVRAAWHRNGRWFAWLEVA